MQLGGEGANKNVQQKTAPLLHAVPFVYNGFPTRSGKRLQLETLDLGSRLLDL